MTWDTCRLGLRASTNENETEMPFYKIDFNSDYSDQKQ